MRCPSCNAENQLIAKFCVECGTALQSHCVKCGFKNPPAAKFCQECGSSLKLGALSPRLQLATLSTSLPKLAIVPQDSDDLPEGERKTVTALFADITGSTAMMESMDPEQARAIVDPALKLMVDAVHRYGGYSAPRRRRKEALMAT
jgi:ribosomal protein L40E